MILIKYIKFSVTYVFPQTNILRCYAGFNQFYLMHSLYGQPTATVALYSENLFEKHNLIQEN